MPHHITFTRLRLVEQPLLFSAAAFACGLICADALKVSANAAFSLFLVVWVAAGIMARRSCRFTASMLIAAFATAGFSLEAIERARVNPTRLKLQVERGVITADQPVTLEGSVAQAELAPDRILLEIEAQRIDDGQVNRPALGRIDVTMFVRDGIARTQFDSLRIEYGTRVRFSCQLRPPVGFRNPGVVSLRSILEQKGVDATTLLRGPEFMTTLGYSRSGLILKSLYRLRASAIRAFLRYLRQPSSGLLVASMFGNENFLDRRVAESFRAGGTYHLLVISGMHVALIAAAMLLITRTIARSRVARLSLTVSAVWAFAIMVGGEPAVTRAAAMISIAVLGQLVSRRVSGANGLGLSAILLLCWNPNDIYGPGFQLSFCTVLVMATVTAPLYERLRAIGGWQPTEISPYPPRCSRPIRALSEVIFWDERRFQRDLRESQIRFRLDKISLARLSRPILFSWVIRNGFATILTTVGIQLALLPLMVLYFHRVSFIAPLSNIVEAFLLSVLMLGGLLFLGVSLLSPHIAEAIGRVLNHAGDLLVQYSRAVDTMPQASLRTPDYGEYCAPVYGFYFAIGVAWALMLARWNPLAPIQTVKSWQSRLAQLTRLSALTLLSLSMIGLVALHPLAPRIERGQLTLTMLDVGQGDSLFLTFPGGRTMLVDAGGRLTFASKSQTESVAFIEDRTGIGEMAIAPFLWHLGVKRLDFIAASHSDADHIQGFVDLVPSFVIGTAFRGPPTSTSDEPFPATLPPSKVATLIRGNNFEIDGVHLEVLAPFPDMVNPRYSPNDRAIVLKVRYGGTAFMLTGDIEKRTEARLLEAGDDLRANVLKVAHHGSRTSTTQAFLNAVSPSIGLISAGSPSPFGHPHADVVARLEKKGVRVLRTPTCGAITVSTDGKAITHRTVIKCE